MSANFDLPAYLETRRKLVDQALRNSLPPAGEWPQRLHESMNYSLNAGGKRLRPILAIAAAETLGKSHAEVLPVACALEMIHTYSLIHDDLPAMDDDDLRRGSPTNHKVFGEAIAILAGDSLLTEAFALIAASSTPERAAATLEVIRRIAQASGSRGMAGGQAVDLLSEKKKISVEELEKLHRHKTGKLIQVSVEAGAIMAGAEAHQLQALSHFGECIGLSFQIADDVLDIEGGVEIGKDIGSDVANEKATYPALLGLEESKRLAQDWTERALNALRTFNTKADPLREIAKYVVARKN
ncbi:MAG TPA: polyprenyl synthetase [Deltaproteobacteria bacterium]|nr:polyprenyl synthetase [Deltaproteobacteria bacterium]